MLSSVSDGRVCLVVFPLAVALGAGFVARPMLTAMVLFGCVFGVICLTNPPLAAALWIPTVFFQAVPMLNLAGKAGGVALACGWLGTKPWMRYNRQIPAFRGEALGIVALVSWLGYTIAWSSYPDLVISIIWQWAAVGVLYIVLIDVLARTVAVYRAMTSFALGAAASAAYGLLTLRDSGHGEALERLEGAAGDPNFFALSLVAAGFVGAGALLYASSPAVKALLAAALVLIALGFVATGSRGGLVALAVSCGAAVGIASLSVRSTLSTGAALAIGVAAWAVWAPASFSRVTSGLDGGSGRSELWRIAWSLIEQRPLVGHGVGHFPTLAMDYLREVGPITSARTVLEGIEVHNLYLELWFEGGLPALLLFVFLAVRAVLNSRMAARRCAPGDRRRALALGVHLAVVSMLVGFIFLSLPVDRRLWIVLALGSASASWVNDAPRSIGTSSATKGREGDGVRPHSWRKGAKFRVVVALAAFVAATSGGLVWSIMRADTFASSAVFVVTPVLRGELPPTLPVVYDLGDPIRTVETAAGLMEVESVFQEAASSLGFGLSAAEVREQVTVGAVGLSNLIEIRAESGSRETSIDVANAVATAILSRRQSDVDAFLRLWWPDDSTSELEPRPAGEDAESEVHRVSLLALATTGDPTIHLVEEAQSAVRLGLSKTLTAILSVGFGIVLGGAVYAGLGRRESSSEEREALASADRS